MSAPAGNTERRTGEPTVPAADGDLAVRFRRIAAETRSHAERCRRAVEAIAEAYRAPYVAFNVQAADRALGHEVVAGSIPATTWKSFADSVQVEALAANAAVIDRLEDRESGLRAAVCGIPIRNWQDEAIGSLVAIVACDDSKLAALTADRLLALMTLLAVPEGPTKVETPAESAALSAEGIASRYDSLDRMSMAIVNGLKNKYGFAEVQLGIVRGGRVRVTTISGRAKFHRGAPGVVRIQQALDETLDAGRPLASNADLDEGFEARRRYALHERWSLETGGCPVLSVPLLDGERVVAIVGMRLESPDSPMPISLAELRQKLAPLGGALALADRLFRPWWRSALDDFARRFGGAERRQRVGAIIAVAAAIALLVWGATEHPYVVAVEARVDNRAREVHAAPFAALLAEVLVRPGDRVEPGTPLYRLDTRPLELRRDQLRAGIELASIRRAAALMSQDSGAAGEAHAELLALSAEAATIDERIDASIGRARRAGFVVGEDLLPRHGEEIAIGDPLVETAADGQTVLKLEIPETMVHEVTVGASGSFASAARPGERIPFRIERVERAAKVVEGRTIYVADAAVDADSAGRLGNSGTARIELGQRTGAWLLWHAPLRYLRHQVNQL
ncbi:MAG TPA: hypothetical protein DCQ98_01995 [Planctomycetaceae bacterium]|nr:hypothetical protein [Planctomycetaceae bacterium]HRF00517.1 biotin/lipoyl-binding protein [Pirellulaceae bacterium]